MTAIRVTGLKEFRSKVKEADAALPKQIRIVLNAAAGIVLDYAKPRIPSRSGRARGSVVARSTQKAVRVSVGGGRAPYYPWLDFGGRVGPGGSVRRPFIKEGRYLYPALRVKRQDVIEAMSTGLVDLVRSAGMEVSG